MHRSRAIVVTALALLVSACGRDDPAALPDPAQTGTPIEIPQSPTPEIDPDARTGFASGTATVTVSGAANLTETYPALGLPALWVPPPGDFAMTWTGPGDRVLTLGGVSFTAQQPTSPERVLTFSIRTVDGPLAFRSDDGSCLVTISPALPDEIGGSFLCSSIVGAGDEGTTITVSARGTFAAA